MSAVTLHRIDAARRMTRFYRLDEQPGLFGQWCFIGRGGQMRETPYPTPSEAEAPSNGRSVILRYRCVIVRPKKHIC